MNFQEVGQKICIIKSEDKKVKKKEDAIYVTSEEDKHKRVEFFQNLELEEGERFQFVPDKKRDRTSLMIVGRNGSGKSYYIAQYLKEFIKMYPTYPIYLFSSKNEDTNLDTIKQIIRVKIDDSFVTNPMKYEDLDKSMCIFDDVDGFRNTAKLPMRNEIYHLRDTILKNGRSYKIHIICTNHDSTGRDVTACLNESDAIVFFMANYNRSQRYLLESYVGLDKDQIKNIRNNKSRSTTYIKSFPNVILQERNISTLSHLMK